MMHRSFYSLGLTALLAAAACSEAEPIGPGDGGPLVDAATPMDTGDPCSQENMRSDPDNCGSCGNRCVLFGADAVCEEGACGLGACRAGYVDLNGDPSDGCEYQCEVTDPLDPIDEEGRDENCDGFDGLLSQLIFVSPSGDDGADGSQAEPVASFAAALELVEPEGNRRAIVIAEGTYSLDGIGQVPAGVSLHGGFRNDGRWTRDAEARATFGETVAPLVIGGGSGVTIEGLELSTQSRDVDRDGPGAAAVGLVIRDGTGVRGHNLIVRAGQGSDGVAGRPGLDGAVGGNGGRGGNGCEDSSGICDNCDRPRGGTGGSSPCGSSGGAGGTPGKGEGNGSAGARGAPGLGEAAEGFPEGENGAGGAAGQSGGGFQSGGQGGGRHRRRGYGRRVAPRRVVLKLTISLPLEKAVSAALAAAGPAAAAAAAAGAAGLVTLAAPQAVAVAAVAAERAAARDRAVVPRLRCWCCPGPRS